MVMVAMITDLIEQLEAKNAKLKGRVEKLDAHRISQSLAYAELFTILQSERAMCGKMASVIKSMYQALVRYPVDLMTKCSLEEARDALAEWREKGGGPLF